MEHREAFCLMKYRSDDGSEEEMLWNSRDGVTPFCIRSRNGEKMMSHVEWNKDTFIIDFDPPPGMRVFVDATLDLVTPDLEAYIEKFWHQGMRKTFGNKDTAFCKLLPDWLHGGKAPWIITVPSEGFDGNS